MAYSLPGEKIMAIVKGDVNRYRNFFVSTICCHWWLYQGPAPLAGKSARESILFEMGLLETLTASGAWTSSPHVCAAKVRSIYAWMEMPMSATLYQLLWLPGDLPLPPARAPSSSSMPVLVLLGAAQDDSVLHSQQHFKCKICKTSFSLQEDDQDKENIAKKQLCPACFASDQLHAALTNADASDL